MIAKKRHAALKRESSKNVAESDTASDATEPSLPRPEVTPLQASNGPQSYSTQTRKLDPKKKL